MRPSETSARIPLYVPCLGVARQPPRASPTPRPPDRTGLRLLRRRAQPRADYAAVARVRGDNAGTDRDGRGDADRVQAEAASGAGAVADPDCGLGAAAAVR